VRRPADAEAYKTRTLADANRDKVKAETDAEAFRQRTLAEANRDTVNFNTEADANRRRVLAEADAEAEKVRAAADAQAKKHEADGDAYAQRTVAAAEAEAINVRADALGDGNQALIAANKLIDVLPQLVEAAAKGIAGSNLTVLNGTEGVSQMVTGMVGQGLSIYETLRKSVTTQSPKASPSEVEAVPTTNGSAADRPAPSLAPSAPTACASRCLTASSIVTRLLRVEGPGSRRLSPVAQAWSIQLWPSHRFRAVHALPSQ
jgi:uncharacterized membrane protein YqiK